MNDIRIGSILPFGGYEWRVLHIEGDTALIITENIIGQRPYNDFAGGVTWEKCSLRKYLNHEFYNTFSEREKARIIPVMNKNLPNHWYEADGGGETKDYIFLLSMEEAVCKYFGDSSKNLENRSAKQRYWFQKKDENNVNRRVRFDGHSWWWWLRTPGRDNKRAVYIHGDGNIGIQGNGTFRYSSNTIHPITGDNSGGVRPALWISIGDNDEKL